MDHGLCTPLVYAIYGVAMPTGIWLTSSKLKLKAGFTLATNANAYCTNALCGLSTIAEVLDNI